MNSRLANNMLQQPKVFSELFFTSWYADSQERLKLFLYNRVKCSVLFRYINKQFLNWSFAFSAEVGTSSNDGEFFWTSFNSIHVIGALSQQQTNPNCEKFQSKIGAVAFIYYPRLHTVAIFLSVVHPASAWLPLYKQIHKILTNFFRSFLWERLAKAKHEVLARTFWFCFLFDTILKLKCIVVNHSHTFITLTTWWCFSESRKVFACRLLSHEIWMKTICQRGTSGQIRSSSIKWIIELPQLKVGLVEF